MDTFQSVGRQCTKPAELGVAAGMTRSVYLVLMLVSMLAVLAGGYGRAGDEPARAKIVKQIIVSGCVTLTPRQIKYKMGTREGKPLDPKILAADFKRLSEMEEVGDIQIKEEQVKGGVRILVILREKGLIRRIVFRGNRQVRRKKLKSLIKSKVGARYDPGQVNRDRRAIEDWYHEEFYYFAKVTTRSEPFEDGQSLVFEVEEGGRMYVQDIIFRGNKHFTKKQLLKFMETRPSTFFTRGRYSRRTFDKDLARLAMLYKKDGYLDVKVIERPFEITSNVPGSRWQRRDAYIHIDIEEGECYRVGRVEFEGNKLVKTEDLVAVIKTTPGEIYSPFTVQEDAKKVRDIYGKYPSSRYFTKVFGEPVVTPSGPVMDVVFHIQEGEEVIVEDVQIVGREKTRDHVIRREIEQLPGEKIDSVKINDTKRNLRNLAYFKDVKVDVKKGSAPNRARVVVDVKEAPTGKLQLGAGISSRESFIGSVELGQRNFDPKAWPKSWKDFFLGKAFCGAGQHFNAVVSAGSRSQNLRFDWLEPWLFDRPVSLGFGGYYRNWAYDRYDEERKGGYLKIGRRLWNKHLFGSITYKLEQVNITDLDSLVSDQIRMEEGRNWLSRMAFNLTFDTRDSRFDPSQGLYLAGTQEFAGTILGGTKDFWKASGAGQLYHTFFRDKRKRPWVLGLRADISAVEAFDSDEHVPIYEKMFAGGIGSIRGFPFHSVAPRDALGDEIGGELKTTMSAEVFVPLYENIIRISAFYDAGTVWKELNEHGDSDWRSSTGFGLHVKTPLGPMPIRLYFIHVIDDVQGDDHQRFQFTFGTNF